MMHKILITSFLFCFLPIFGQDESSDLLLYKNVIEKSDSLFAIGKISEIDSKMVIDLAKKSDREYPSKYFQNSLQLFKDSKYNESAFLYYLGKMRTADFNNYGNGHFQPSTDDHVILEEGLIMYMTLDADNFVKILKMAKDFYQTNDYLYISKNKGYQKVKSPENYNELITEIENNKSKARQELSSQRDEMKKHVLEYLQYFKSK
ncbi:hypothetical protein PFY12_13010 [Chryseobacterium camelliae]|uniref:DUF4919 domain-containing protein n=1 Tax=Chryseobacterium camelliae TaxID=1265445 RepID=A0ABY7QJU7_9FLAO|nr:hypothetical protein [Chryseobacterium camelliae]WBV59955.1 hypothetical protein PFY12_13010 [Chryseobacterium camelliae]